MHTMPENVVTDVELNEVLAVLESAEKLWEKIPTGERSDPCEECCDGVIRAGAMFGDVPCPVCDGRGVRQVYGPAWKKPPFDALRAQLATLRLVYDQAARQVYLGEEPVIRPERRELDAIRGAIEFAIENARRIFMLNTF